MVPGLGFIGFIGFIGFRQVTLALSMVPYLLYRALRYWPLGSIGYGIQVVCKRSVKGPY